MWPLWCVGWYDTVILFCLVSKVHFNCVVQDSLYHDMDIGIMWHCVLVSCTPSQSIGLVLGCALMLSVIMYYFSNFLDRVLFHHEFHHDSCDCYWIFMSILFSWNHTFKLSVTKYFWFCKCATPWMFPHLDILLEYWIEHVTLVLLCVTFTFPTRIFCRGVPGFAIDCPYGVWCRGFDTKEKTFFLIVSHIHMYLKG